MATKEVVARRTNDIVAYLKAHAGEVVTRSDLVKYVLKGEIGENAVSHMMATKILKSYPVDIIPSKGYMYYPEKSTDDAPKGADPIPEKPFKNAEGYSDPTMGAVLHKLEPTLEWVPGDVWKSETRLGGEELVLILAATKGRVTVLKLWQEKKDEFTSAISVFYQNKILWTDPSEICFRTTRALTRKAMTARRSDYETVKKSLGKYLDTTVTKEVVKEVPKITTVTQTVEKKVQDPVLVQELEEAKVTIKDLSDKLGKAAVAPTEEVLVLKAQLATYREIFATMFPERRTDE